MARPTRLARPTRRRNRFAYLLIALGVGVAAFSLLDPDPGADLRLDTGVTEPSATSPTVLGSIVTRGAGVVEAEPASPATFDEASSSVRRAPTTTVRRSSGPTSTTPPPTIGTPWSTENTTTTEEEPTTSTTDTPTTTEPPPPTEP